MPKEIPIFEPLQPIPERSFHNTLAFVENVSVSTDAKPESGHFPPKGPRTSEEDWARNWTLGGRYLSDTKASLAEVSKSIEGVGPTRAQQIFPELITSLHIGSSAELQNDFPLHLLQLNKLHDTTHSVGREKNRKKNGVIKDKLIDKEELQKIRSGVADFFNANIQSSNS